ncbi:hypothetical protein [Persephonella sp.]
MNIVLDFGDKTTVLDEKHYECKTSGNWLAVICRATGKRWVYRILGAGFGRNEMRFRVKEAQEPVIRRKVIHSAAAGP